MEPSAPLSPGSTSLHEARRPALAGPHMLRTRGQAGRFTRLRRFSAPIFTPGWLAGSRRPDQGFPACDVASRNPVAARRVAGFPRWMPRRFPDDVPVLTDGTVRLRAHCPQDAAAIVEQCTDPQSM